MGQKDKIYSDQIIDFTNVFEEHSKHNFICEGKRKNIFNDIDKFIDVSNKNNNYLIIKADSGLGKTSLIVNYIRQKKNDHIYYFLDKFNKITLDPSTFINYLNYSLDNIFNFKSTNSNDDLNSKIINCQKKIDRAKKILLKDQRVQTIFFESLDDALYRDNNPTNNIIDLINNFIFPVQFKIIITTKSRLDSFPLKIRTIDIQEITLEGGVEENKWDLIPYCYNNLKNSIRDKEKVARIIIFSEGNFRFLVWIIEYLNKYDEDLTFHNLEKDLESLFISHLFKIKGCVSKSIFEKIKEIIILVTVLEHPIEKEIICNILKIETFERYETFVHIEQFFDQNLYKSNKCFWFHLSFLFITEKKIRDENRDLSDRVVHKLEEYVLDNIKRGSILDLSEYLIVGCFYYYQSTSILSFLNSFRNKYLININLFYKNNNLHIPSNIIKHALKKSFQIKSRNNIFFFSFLTFVIKRVVTGSDAFFEELTKNHKIKMIRKMSNIEQAKNISKLHLNEGLNYLDRFCLKGNEREEIESIIVTYLFIAYRKIRGKFKDFNKAYDKCNYFANEWFPIEEKKSNKILSQKNMILNQERNKSHAPNLKDNSPSLPTDTKINIANYIVHENWKDPKPVNDTKDLDIYYKNLKTYDIFLDYTKQTPIIHHKLQPVFINDIEPKSLAILIEILKSAHKSEQSTLKLFDETITDKRNITHFDAERKHRNIQQTLSKCNKAFGKCIKIKWGKKRYNDYNFVLLHEFTYCLIESINSNPDTDLN